MSDDVNGVLTAEYTPPVGRMPAISKVEKFDWRMIGEPGQFHWMPKQRLHVDHEYQRSRVSNTKVLAIAAEWVWPACGVLSVARRPDGTLWVFDGQHRKLAADKRADVQVLPCMVYEMTDRLNEALAFLKINTFRTAMQSVDKMNAELIAQDPIAMAVRAMVEGSGYAITASDGSNSGQQWTVKCVSALKGAVRQNQRAANVAWLICVELFQGKIVTDDVFSGLFALECHLARKSAGSLTDEHNRTALARHTLKEVVGSINEAKAFMGGGAKAAGEGIVRLLNKGRRSRRIPTMYSEQQSDE